MPMWLQKLLKRLRRWRTYWAAVPTRTLQLLQVKKGAQQVTQRREQLVQDGALLAGQAQQCELGRMSGEELHTLARPWLEQAHGYALWRRRRS